MCNGLDKPFWNKKWGKDQKCAITCSRLRPGKDRNGLSYTIELECGHRFWRKALVQWVITSYANTTEHAHPSCPVCRQHIKKL
jgi:hypothetical protein